MSDPEHEEILRLLDSTHSNIRKAVQEGLADGSMTHAEVNNLVAFSLRLKEATLPSITDETAQP